MSAMTTLESTPYKGTRDWYPAEKRVQNYIFSTWRKVVESYGYQEYGAPLLEPLEVYTSKSGEELANEQTYTFTDRGDRTVAIRPEMTPTISRMVAARRQELGLPARLYSIANFMRYERPQRGREREFWQLNVDMFGVEGTLADAEMITMARDVMKAFGAKSSMYTIRVNNRQLISAMMHDYLQLDAVQSQMMMKLFDRKAKITTEEFRDQAYEILGEQQATEGLRKIAELVAAQSIADLPAAVRELPAVVAVQELFDQLHTAKVKNAAFDITLMRGLDYYTDTVFEVFDTDPENNRSMFGGGRYDGLVGLFGAEPLSAVGMAPGLTTTELFLRSHNLLPEQSSTTDVAIIVIGDVMSAAQKLARDLRNEGVNVALDITGRKLDKQVKAAVKQDVAYILFIGEQEATDEVYTLKDTASTTEEKLSFARVVTTVKDRRRRGGDDDDDLLV